jgi:hypothetical protein
MEIKVKKLHLKDPKEDFQYWQNQPYEARLEALENIRSRYHQWKSNTQPRLQRV